jgi:hypothetical protein
VEDAGQCIRELNDGFGIYKVGMRVTPAARDDVTDYHSFRALFHPDASDLVKSHFLLVEFGTSGNPPSETKSLLNRITAHFETLGVLFSTAVVSGCIAAFVYKDNFMKLRSRLSLGDVNPSAVLRLIMSKGTGVKVAKQKQLDAFVTWGGLPAERVENMCIRGSDDSEASHWTWEQAVQYVQQVNEQTWTSLIANAEGRKAAKFELSVAEKNLLVYKGRLEAHLRPRFEASMLVRMASMVKPVISEYPDAVKQMQTLDFDHVSGSVIRSTLQEVVNSVKIYKKAIFLIGDAGAGKDNLLNAVASLVCRRDGFETFMVSDALDPYGAATKAGLTGQQGAFVCNDGELKSTLHGRLSTEEIKKLFNVELVGAYNARYGTAQLPGGRPRMFSMNSSLGVSRVLGAQPSGTNEDINWAAWFEKEGIGFVKHLLDGNAGAILKLSAVDRAIVRRMIVVKVPGRLFSVSAAGSFESDLRQQVAHRVAAVPW